MTAWSRARISLAVLSLWLAVVGGAHSAATEDAGSRKSLEQLETSFVGMGAAIDPVHNRIYLLHCGPCFGSPSFQIRALDGDTHAVIQQITLNDSPQFGGIAVDPDREKLFVLVRLPFPLAGEALRVHDSDSLALEESIDLPSAGGGGEVVVDGATGLVWVGNRQASSITAIDPDLPIGSPDRVRAFLLPSLSCSASVAVNTRTGYVYAGCRHNIQVLIGDPTRPGFGGIVATLAPPSPANRWFDESGGCLSVDILRNELYACWGDYPVSGLIPDHQVLAFEADPSRPAFNQVVRSITLPNHPENNTSGATALDVNPITGRLYVKTAPLNFGETGSWPRKPLMVFDSVSGVLLDSRLLPMEHDLGLERVVVNTVTSRAYVTTSVTTTPVRDTVIQQAATASDGSVAEVTLDLTSASLTFADVTAAGITTVTPIDAEQANLTLPGQFSIEGAPAYEIATTVGFSGPITLCFPTAVEDPDVFASLVVLHGENGAWVPQPTLHHLETRELCVTVSSLSPFVISRHTTTWFVQAIFDTSRAFRSGATAPIRIRILDPWGVNQSSATIPVRAMGIVHVSANASSTVQDSGHANPEQNFRYSSELDGYVFNLSTKGLAAGTLRDSDEGCRRSRPAVGAVPGPVMVRVARDRFPLVEFRV